eukprot:COSAG05_NODE_9716_length_606_cov_1.530572_1_plen_149_part_01
MVPHAEREAARPAMAATAAASTATTSQSRSYVGAHVATKASTFDGPDKSHAWSKGAYGRAWASALCVGKIVAPGIASHEWTVLFDDGDEYDCTERQLLCRVPKDGQSTSRLCDNEDDEDVQPVVADGRQHMYMSPTTATPPSAQRRPRV